MTNIINQNLISSLISDHDKVLDIGCGSGELLYFLEQTKKIQGQVDQEQKPK